MMKPTNPTPLRPALSRSPWRRLRDAVLLPLALALVSFDWGLREGSRVLRRWRPIREIEARMSRLPPWAILPLFLIPEVMSHIAGFYATYLLTQRQFLTATLVAVLVKGVGLVIALWIYQACRPALMTIGWFAWSHGKVEAARHWALSRFRPTWARAGRLWRQVLWGRRAAEIEPGAARAGRRLAAIRARLRTQLTRLR
jgi:hypothetical protein